jgi:hypothetical protein
VNADAGGGFVEQAVNNVELGLERRERLERFANLHLAAAARGRPVVGVDSAGHEERGEALGKCGSRIAGCRRRSG